MKWLVKDFILPAQSIADELTVRDGTKISIVKTSAETITNVY